ncbi:MAG: 30S ribosome-binding factor RbfA [Gammaproteobacteria bacterium]|jgi:ribosome-binding factor A
MHDFGREERVGAAMRRELSVLVREEIKDPRLGMITIQEVRVSRDLSHAKVYYTVLDDTRIKQTQQVLDKAANFLRRRLGEHMVLRSVPQLHFVYDKSVVEGMRLSALIEEAVTRDRKSHGED